MTDMHSSRGSSKTTLQADLSSRFQALSKSLRNQFKGRERSQRRRTSVGEFIAASGVESLEPRLVMSASITPIQEKTAFYEGISSFQMPQVNSPYTISVADASINSSTVIDTANGSLIGLAQYGQGRVAVIGNTGILNRGLQSDPASNAWARGVFNLYSWVSDTARTVGQTDKLYVLRGNDTGAHSAYNLGIPENQSLFLDYLAAETSYAAAGANGATVTGLTRSFTEAGAISEALLPDGAWSRHNGVVEVDSSAGADVIKLVKDWMAATGGGVIIDADTSYGVSDEVRAFVTSLGLSISTSAGNTMTAGDYTPAKIDPKNSDIIFQQLTGLSSTAFGQTAAKPILIQDSIKLPTEIMGATVSWTSSAAGTLSDTGVAGTDGTATLTAHVAFRDGTIVDQAIYYKLFHPTAGTGLERRIIDTTGYTYGGSTPGSQELYKFMDTTLLARTPVNDVTVTSPNWSNTANTWPTASYHSTLWTYSGYIVAPTTGSYTLKITADDSARLYIQHDGQITSQTAAWWFDNGADQTVNLEAGKAYRIWLFFKPSGGGTDYVTLKWQTPGSASFVDVPASALAQLPSGYVPSNAGYPADLLPWSTVTTTNLTTTQIISDAGLTTLRGNLAPTAANQQFNLQKNGLYINPQDIRFTDAVATQVKTVCLRLVNADGTTSFLLNNVALSGVTNGATLASAIQTLVNTANAASGSTGTVTVTYANNLLKVTDSAGRKITDFILTKQALNVQTVNGTPNYSVAGQATVPFDLNNVHQATRLSFSLAANGSGPAVGLADLMFQGVGYGDPANLAPFLQDAVQAAMGNSDVTITWNPTGADPLIGNLLFSDAKGRVFSNLALTDQSKYVPLMEMAGPSTGGNGSASVGTIGGISGTAYASDGNGDTLTYSLLEQPKFGTVTLNTSNGQYFYQPAAGGAFQGFDLFTLQATDSLGASSAPFGITITSEEAPQVAIPVVKTYTIPDPVYTEPGVKPGVNLPADWQFKDVFTAQTHVQRPTDPYLELTQNRYALIKLNGISASGTAAPDFTAYVTDANGNTVGSLRLTGPANLPTSVSLPTLANYGQGLQSDADSYTAPLPGAWIKPGMKITIMATGSATPITSFSPKVGSDLNLNLSVMNLSMHGINDGAYMAGIEDWAQQALVNLPAGAITLYEYPFLNINSFGKEQSGVWGNYTGNNSGLPGSDPILYDGGFQGVIGYAIHLAGQLRGANGGYGSIVYMADHVEPGGGLGGGSIGGGGPSPGIFWHEVMGHGEGRGHAAADTAYPYNNVVTTAGTDAQSGWLGPNWGYNQITGQYQQTSVKNANGTISLYTDPQAGGWQDHPGNIFGMFSDYYSYLNHQYMDGQTQWVPDNSLAGAL